MINDYLALLSVISYLLIIVFILVREFIKDFDALFSKDKVIKMTYEQKLKRLSAIARIASKIKAEKAQARAMYYASKRRQLEERGLL